MNWRVLHRQILQPEQLLSQVNPQQSKMPARLYMLSRTLRDIFLVATAGPDLEGIIAAKGAGTLQQSKNTAKVIANIDIGGGTANIAVMQFGEVIGTCTLHIGGRLIEFHHGVVQSISSPIRKLMDTWPDPLSVGDAAEDKRVIRCMEEMVDTLAMTLSGQLTDERHPLLLGHLPAGINR